MKKKLKILLAQLNPIGGDVKGNFKKLEEVVKVVTRNLNKIIDINYYQFNRSAHSAGPSSDNIGEAKR